MPQSLQGPEPANFVPADVKTYNMTGSLAGTVRKPSYTRFIIYIYI